MISLLIVAPIMLIIIGPISVVLGNWLLAGCQVMSKWGWIAVGINAAIFPLMVLTGTHNATIPLIVQMFAKQGFDPIFLTSGMAANMAEAGAAGAVALKTKNKGLRGTAISASVSALLGITEPALYGVNLRLKRPFAAVLLGSLLGGCYIGMIGLTAPTFVTPSILTAPIFVGAGVNLLVGLSAIPVCYFITFIITYLFGFEDIGVKESYINAPIKGEVIELEKVSDKAFSSKSMGDGFAIIPEEGKVVAPFDCDIEALFPTKHAIGLKRIDGLELLIHIGFDTVNLNGEFFEVLVKTGDHVKAGDTLITFDIAAIKNKGYEVTTPVIVTNSVDFKKIKLEHKGVVNEGEKVLYVEQ
jgi:PTS system beta-glucosides-specific IIC component